MTEEQLFEIKQKFLQVIPHPKLIQKQIERLKKFELDGIPIKEIALQRKGTLQNFLSDHISESLNMKLKIANAKNGGDLYQYLCVLKKQQNLLIQKLISYFPQNVEVNDSSIKQSDPFDTYVYLKELKDQNVKENEIKDYLCTQFRKEPSMQSELAKGVLRARKIGVE